MDVNKRASITEEAARERGVKFRRSAREWIISAAAVLLAAAAVRSSLFTLVRVDGNSMSGTLQNGERMLVSVAPENVAAFEEIMQDDAMPAGEVAATQWLEIHLADAELNLPVAQMQKLWEEALPCAMKSKD